MSDSRDAAIDGAVARLLELAVERGALQYGDFLLSSGARSPYYFDGRLLSLDPEGGHCIAQALLPLVHRAGAEAIGGPTLGADPIVAAVALLSYQQGAPVSAFIVREGQKAHGTGRTVEGPLKPGTQVAIVDDVCTTGGSLFHAIQAAEEMGCSVVQVLVILDRHQGGSDELRRRGYVFRALLEAEPDGRVSPAKGDEKRATCP